MSNFDSRNPQNKWLHFHNFYLRGGENWEGGGVLRGGSFEGQEDKGEGGFRCLLFWEGREVAAGWEWGRCSGNCTPPTCMSPPSSLPQAWCQVGQGCSARWNVPVSHPFPPNPPVSPTDADHKRSQNDPKMILVSF